jgi:Tol biopolymer transport system component
VLQRFTSDAAQEYNGVWSPDGGRLVFESNRNGILDLYEKHVGGSSTESMLLASAEHKNALDWSPDGRHLLYASQTATTGRDIWSLPLFGDRRPFAVVRTAFEETIARFSPDGRWIAFQSNETGRNEIYVQPFPGPGGKSQISTAGGTEPRWRRNGRELYYLSTDSRLMSVGLTVTDQTRMSAVPEALFSLPAILAGAEYEAAPDGQRFLFTAITRDASPITILLNWKPQ